MLIVMRIVQGLAGGAMVPMSQAILLESFPREQHGKLWRPSVLLLVSAVPRR